jgi:hypothetical protein
MTATRIRRLAALAVAVAGLTAVAAPAANADRIEVTSTVSIPSPYNQNSLSGSNVFEQFGPVMVNVRRKITCLRGTVRRPGYPAMCQWSTGLYGVGATVSEVPVQGDVYSVGNGYAAGTTFHAGNIRAGYVGYDNWSLIVRDDNLREAAERFRLSTSTTGGNSVYKEFTIIDND